MLPHEAREPPLPVVNRHFFARRTDHETDLADDISHHARFPGYKRTIALYQESVAFPTKDAVQNMVALVAEKDHIHGLELGLSAGVQNDLVALVAEQREHGMSLQAEADGTAFGYLRLHPGEEQVIGYLLHR